MNKIDKTVQLIGDVQLGEGNTICPYVVIRGPVKIGDGNTIDPFTVIGSPAEYRGKDSVGGVEIGNRNHIGEHVTIHQAMEGKTVIGNDNYIMTKVHVGHDAVIGDDVTLASGCIIGGHSHVDNSSNIGLGAVIHQKRAVGMFAMVGMNATVSRSIPPYVVAMGTPAKPERINVVGLQRRGHDDEFITAAQYWLNFYKTHVRLRNAMSNIVDEQISKWTILVEGLEGK